MIKQNIKMRVTPKQSRKVQETCFDNGVYWPRDKNIIQFENQKYLYINDEYIVYGNTYEYFEEYGAKEIDADLFIRTNGTCEDTTLNDYDIDFKDEEYNKIEKKVFNLKKQLEKYVIKIDNQKEEISRLLNQKEELKYKLNGVTNLVELSIQNDDLWAKELKEKDAVIKYLENKLDI